MPDDSNGGKTTDIASTSTTSSLHQISTFGYEEPTTTLTTSQKPWYPKLTPFRLSTLFIGASLGILKAILTYKGSQIAPVVVEWICGTAFFLLFYFLDILEKDIRLQDDSYHWFYDYDCLNLFWKFLKSFGINTPEYSNTEAPVWDPNYSTQLITNYRLLVSATILCLGMLKAVLVYLGKSAGATAMDWILGVIVTTGLYILGLYESNTEKLLPSLFSRNDSPTVLFVGYEGGLMLLGIALTCIFLVAVHFTKAWLKFALSGEGHAGPIDLRTMDGFKTLSFDVFLVSVLVVLGYLSLYPLYRAILILLRYFESSAAIPRLATSLMQRWGLSRFQPRYSIVSTQDLSDRALYIFRSLNHLILHAFFLVVLSCVSILTGSFVIDLLSTSLFFIGLFLLPLVLMIAASTILVVLSMMRPFYRRCQTGVWRGRATDLGFLF